MGLLDGLVDILVNGLNRILGKGVDIISDWLTEILTVVVEPIIRISVYSPAPQPESGLLFGRPTNSPWKMIYDQYWEVMLPFGLLLLFVSYVISRAGAAWGLGPAAVEQRTQRGLIRGLVLLPVSWYLVVGFLRFNEAFTGAFAPDAGDTADSIARFSYSHPDLAGAAFSLLVIALGSLSLFAYLFLVLIHVLRITAIFLIVYSLPLLLGLNFGQYPFVGKYSQRIYSYLPILSFISIPVAITFRFSIALWESGEGITISGLTVGSLFSPLFLLAPAVIAVLLPVMMVLNAPGVTSLSILGKGALRDRREAAKSGASKARSKYSNWRSTDDGGSDDPDSGGGSSTPSNGGGSSGGGWAGNGEVSSLMPSKQTPSAIERSGPPDDGPPTGALRPAASSANASSGQTPALPGASTDYKATPTGGTAPVENQPTSAAATSSSPAYRATPAGETEVAAQSVSAEQTPTPDRQQTAEATPTTDGQQSGSTPSTPSQPTESVQQSPTPREPSRRRPKQVREMKRELGRKQRREQHLYNPERYADYHSGSREGPPTDSEQSDEDTLDRESRRNPVDDREGPQSWTPTENRSTDRTADDPDFNT